LIALAAACGSNGDSSAGPASDDASTDSPIAEAAADGPPRDASPSDGAPDGAPGDAPSDADASTSSKGRSLIWVWGDWVNSLASVASNPKSFTDVAPTFYDVNYAYQSGVAHFTSNANTDSFDGLTSTKIAQQIHAAGMRCTPLVYGGAGNSGTDQGIQNILNDAPSGARASFISSMIGEAQAKGYDGYNLDWEVNTGQTDYAGYGAKLETFLATFKAALHQKGLTLSIDIGDWFVKQSYCSGGNGMVDLTALAPNVDLVILMDYKLKLGTASTKCPSSIPNPQSCGNDFVSTLNLMCVYMPNDVISIGFNADPQVNNPIAGQSVSTVQSYGIHAVAIWPDSNSDGPNGGFAFLDTKNIQPTNATWYSLLAGYLAAQ
jgi:hypothetical protein